MDRPNKLQAMYDAEARLVIERSALLLQPREDGFSGEMYSSGAIVEGYIKDLLRKHTPNGYRLCSGYIATPESLKESANLQQHDVIILDDRIPSITRFEYGDIEVVPAEAVCGVIEVKRTLTKKSLAAAIDHLRKTYQLLDGYSDGVKSKTSSAPNAAGPTLSFATHAPLYGVVGLTVADDIVGPAALDFCNTVMTPAIHEFIDIVWAPASAFFARHAVRDSDHQLVYPHQVTRRQEGAEDWCVTDFDGQDSPGRSYGAALAAYRFWINKTAGATMQMEGRATFDYFGIALLSTVWTPFRAVCAVRVVQQIRTLGALICAAREVSSRHPKLLGQTTPSGYSG